MQCVRGGLCTSAAAWRAHSRAVRGVDGLDMAFFNLKYRLDNLSTRAEGDRQLATTVTTIAGWSRACMETGRYVCPLTSPARPRLLFGGAGPGASHGASAARAGAPAAGRCGTGDSSHCPLAHGVWSRSRRPSSGPGASPGRPARPGRRAGAACAWLKRWGGSSGGAAIVDEACTSRMFEGWRERRGKCRGMDLGGYSSMGDAAADTYLSGLSVTQSTPKAH